MPAIVHEVQLDPMCLQSTDRIQFSLYKDGVAWDDADSVELTFEAPDRATQFNRDMVQSAELHTWYYDTEADDFTTVGWWTVGVVVTAGAIVKHYPYEIGFYISDVP